MVGASGVKMAKVKRWCCLRLSQCFLKGSNGENITELVKATDDLTLSEQPLKSMSRFFLNGRHAEAKYSY